MRRYARSVIVFYIIDLTYLLTYLLILWSRVPINPSAWGHLNPSSYCDVGKLFYGVFKLWSKLQRKKMKK